MICDVCTRAFAHPTGYIGREHADTRLQNTYAHQPSLDSLQASVNQYCNICRPLWERLPEDAQAALRREEHEIKEYEKETTPIESDEEDHGRIGPFRCMTRYNLGLPSESNLLHINFARASMDWVNLYPVHGSYILLLSRATPQPDELEYDACDAVTGPNLAPAIKWLQDCVSNHINCNEGYGRPAFYPTRLLDLRTMQDSGLVKIIDTALTPPTGPYVTLSHCWGRRPMFRLTRDTEAALRAGIDVTSMPKTFKEAAQVATGLGVFNLWIDALCIFQDKDDLSDWYGEATRMRDVYSHSYYNISASAARDSSEELFFDRPPGIIKPAKIEVPNRHFRYNITDSVINKRGWVLQERLLAPRVLHFGRDQMLWECREHECCESYLDPLPSFLERFTGTRFKSLLPTPTAWRTELESQNDIGRIVLETWSQIIREYSRTHLSVATDKLVALSGVAKEIKRYTNDEYIARMWGKYFVPQLMWYLLDEVSDEEMSSRPTEYRAPSWSWASIEGEIGYGDLYYYDTLVRVVNYHLGYASPDTTGAITSGWLILEGQLKPTRLYRAHNPEEGNIWIMDLTPHDRTEVREHLSNSTRPVVQSSFNFRISLDVLSDAEDPSFEMDNHTGGFFYMPVLGYEAGAGTKYNNTEALILHLLDTDAGVFKRLGVVWSTSSHITNRLLSPLDEEVAAELPCISFSGGLHTIKIIWLAKYIAELSNTLFRPTSH